MLLGTYILDEITDRYVFLEDLDETNQLVITSSDLSSDSDELVEGMVVLISKMNNSYQVKLLKEETEKRYQEAKSLLEDLINNNLDK